jgi:hypothetical protein
MATIPREEYFRAIRARESLPEEAGAVINHDSPLRATCDAVLPHQQRGAATRLRESLIRADER